MGMDYQYAGSASYPRFDRELCEVAKVFGGIETAHLKERRETESERPLGYWFGFLSSDDSKEQKFSFPEGTNDILVKWFNDIYSESFTPEETKIVWKNISKHPEIEEISNQIWYELEALCEDNEAWELY
jgi:hypothetical protein